MKWRNKNILRLTPDKSWFQSSCWISLYNVYSPFVIFKFFTLAAPIVLRRKIPASAAYKKNNNCQTGGWRQADIKISRLNDQQQSLRLNIVKIKFCWFKIENAKLEHVITLVTRKSSQRHKRGYSKTSNWLLTSLTGWNFRLVSFDKALRSDWTASINFRDRSSRVFDMFEMISSEPSHKLIFYLCWDLYHFWPF